MTTPGISTSTRAHLFRDVRDSDGNVVPNVKITVYERGSAQLLQSVIYRAPSGSEVLTNPFTTSSGFVDFYLAEPQDVAIGVSVAAQGGVEQRVEDLAVMPPANQLVRSPVGFQIINNPDPGKYLQATDGRKALWVSADDVMASRPTPTVLLKAYDFSVSYLDDLKIVGSTHFADVGVDTKPQGYGFLQALSFTGSVTVPAQHFPEPGRVIFAYKLISGAYGQYGARLRVSIDDRTVWVLTPTAADYVGVWSIGYLEITEPGTHTVIFEQVAGGDTLSEVLLGPVTVQYGNNIAPHEHTGTGDASVRLGTDSVASAARTTALGALAKAESADATAIGANAVAGARGTAIGSQTWAAADSLALGYRADGASGAVNWVALGSQAIAEGTDSVTIGYDSSAGADGALALGAGADATGKESIAIGEGAEATGYRALALGAGATADYDFSMAIGPGVVATAAHEARLGDGDTVVVMPGSLRHTGAQAVIGSAGTKLGFYGQAPVAQPVVRGSRGGNQVLAQLLATLDGLGLVDDRSTT